MKYVDFEQSGKIVAFYDDAIHGPRAVPDDDGNPVPNPDTKVPEKALGMTDETWEAVIENTSAWWVNPKTKAIELRPLPSKAELDERLPAYRDRAYREVRATILQFVTGEAAADFPEWKQANYNQAYAELLVAELRGEMSTEQNQQLARIRSAISWKNGVLAERDRVKAAITAAGSTAAIDAVVKSLQLAAPPFAL